jgi:O-antigen/teichoic acid export membrane protein
MGRAMADTSPPSASLRHRLAGGGAWAILGKGGTLGLNFLAVALVARVLEPSDAGAYFLAQSVVNAAAMIARLGLESTVVYLVSSALGSGNPARARRIIRQVVLVGASSAAAMGALLSLGGAAWIGHTIFDSALVARVGTAVGVWSAALALQMLLSEAFRGFHAIREAVLFGGVITGAAIIVGLSAPRLTNTTLSLESAVWIAAAATLTNAALAAIALTVRSRQLGPASTAEPADHSLIVRSALPVLANNVMTFVLLNVDVWVVGAHLPEREVATYAAAARMVTLVGLSLMIANQVLPPVIGELFARGDRRLLERVLRGTAAAVAPPALLVLAAFVFAGPLVMRTGFGAFYEKGAPVLVFLSLGQLAGVLTGSSVPVLLMTGHQRAAMGISAGAAVAATIASLVAVPRWGATGVALATSTVVVAQQLATLVAARRLAGVWTHAGFSEIRLALEEMRQRRASK